MCYAAINFRTINDKVNFEPYHWDKAVGIPIPSK